MRVAVLGGAGFVGGELLRILLGHPEVEDVLATSRSRAGEPIGDVHPPLASRTRLVFRNDRPGQAARGRDAVFLALEHGASSRVMAEVLEAEPSLVVDLAADFRIADAGLREGAYGPHVAPGLTPLFVYALADVLGESLCGATALAMPGCFATAAALALWPLASAGLEAPPVLFAVTGSSGGGTRLRSAAHHPLRAHNLFAYGVFGHRHEAEVADRWRAWTGPNGASPRLAVHAGPFVRGIYLTLHARLSGNAGEIAAAYREAYAGRPFVRVLSDPPELTHVLGTNDARIHAASSDDGRELQTMVAIDNLVKGAAGQAVQAVNLALGIPEETGLAWIGGFPC